MNGIATLPQSTGTVERASGAVTGRVAKADAEASLAGLNQRPGAYVQADDAKLSSAVGLVREALSGSDVRTAKVAALQQSIAAGTYNVATSDVADKLMAALLE